MGGTSFRDVDGRSMVTGGEAEDISTSINRYVQEVRALLRASFSSVK